MRRRTAIATSASLGLVALLLPVANAGAGSTKAADRTGPDVGVRHVSPEIANGKALSLRDDARQVAAMARRQQAGHERAQLGDERIWLALDDTDDSIYVKDYKLRGRGDKIEVWTASGKDDVSRRLQFPAGDCRNGERTRITDAQVTSLIDEFDSNIFPKESDAFSVPPDRDGTNAPLPELVGLPDNYYKGQGDRIVVLVDNVRDANFYDLNNTKGKSYIAGFFTSTFNELLDRNVMTIDGFDWLHRTGANPPNEPVGGDNCASAPARPFLYESVFAHEYQHLLEYYEDPDEVNWVNEGLADWAQTLTGYVDPSVPIDNIDFDSHIQCFLGYLGENTLANPNPREGGPENSLTAWEDQGDDEVLCDYGAAYTMMEYLRDRYGEDFMTRLHRGNRNGLDALANNVAKEGTTESAADVVHKWAAMVALDKSIDRGATLNGGSAARYSTDTLNADINWSTPETYSDDGAPPNGSDYVRLRSNEPAAYFQANEINEIAFNGASALPSLPREWKVDRNPPQHKSNAFYSGSGADLDRAIVRKVRVPQNNPTLRFDTKWRTEKGWDFGFVQVSTNGGKSYKSIGNKDTTTKTAAGAIGSVKANVPGFTGNSKGWRTERFNLKKYAGERILVSFRYVTDPAVNKPGWWVDNVRTGKKLVSRGGSLRKWQTPTQIVRTPVSGFTVQLVAYDNAGTAAWVADVPLDNDFDGTLAGADVDAAIGDSAQTVAAIVTYDEPDEERSPTQYARYALSVNDVLQPGGGRNRAP